MSASFHENLMPRQAAPSRLVPPHNLEAEMGVLGSILMHNQSVDYAYEIGLKGEDFYKEAHKLIYQTIIDLLGKSLPADTITVTNHLSATGNLEKAGGSSYLAELATYEYSPSNVNAYAKIVKDKSIERKIIHACQEQASKGLAGVEDHENYKEETEKKILAATEETTRQTYSSLGDTLLETMSHLQEVASKDQSVTGVPSGFVDLDKETMGWHSGQLIIVAARPGMGKTSFMLNVALNASLDHKVPVAIFSLEMSKRELTMRLISMEAEVDANRLKNASKMQERDWKNLQRVGPQLAESPFFIDDSSELNILELKSRCRRIQNQHGLGLVVVDYLQLMKGLGRTDGSSSARAQEIAEISRGLKSLAKELSVPIIAASQLNRAVESRQVKRPQLSDLRESGSIEQDADMVLFIHREKDNPELQREAELIIGKHRSGSTGDVKLSWDGQYTRFRNYAWSTDGAPQGSGHDSIF